MSGERSAVPCSHPPTPGGAPLRVHVLSLAILFLAVPVSPWLCSKLKNPIRRLGLSLICAVVCFFIWDSTAQVVIVKAEFIEILKDRPWVYLIVGVVLGAFIFAITQLIIALNTYKASRCQEKKRS
jgi:uncharacterized membrane protein YhfC